MNSAENLHCETAENWEISDENTKQKATVNAKNKNKGALKDATKRINDYFPVVPKANVEKGEDSGVASKDESRVTEHTTPDKWILENSIWHINGDSKGKIRASNRRFAISKYIIDICLRLHCLYPSFGAKGFN